MDQNNFGSPPRISLKTIRHILFNYYDLLSPVCLHELLEGKGRIYFLNSTNTYSSTRNLVNWYPRHSTCSQCE